MGELLDVLAGEGSDARRFAKPAIAPRMPAAVVAAAAL